MSEPLPVSLIILTSAGIAALVSGIIALFGQMLERRARRRELLLTKSIELAIQRTDLAERFAKTEGAPVTLLDHAQLAEVYYQWLSHLVDHGELPPDAPAARSARRNLPLDKRA